MIARPTGRLLAIALVSAMIARLVAHRVLHDVPHVMDEIAYLFEAKLIAAGTLRAPIELPRAAFNMWFVDDRTSRFGIFPPGWTVLLAGAVRVHLVQWINPLLHFATVLVVGRTGERLSGARVGFIAALIYAASPQTVLLAASLMSHSLVALASSVVVLAIVTVLREDRLSRSLGVAGGMAIGIVAATRPLCAVVVAAPLAVSLLLWNRRALPVVALGAAPFVVLLGAFNRALTGSAFRFPQNAYFDEHLGPSNVRFFSYGKGCNGLGFGPACDHSVRGAVHTVHAALTDAGDNLRAWAILLPAPVILVGIILALRLRGERRALSLLAPAVLAIGLYGLYWQSGVCYGARFYHAAVPGLVCVSALGWAAVLDRPAKTVLATAFGLVFVVLGFTTALREMTTWSFWGTDDRFAKLRDGWHERHDHRAVVMVAFGPDDVRNPELDAIASMRPGMWLLSIRALGALAANEPRPEDGAVVFAKFHPALVDALQERFSDRDFWLYTAWADGSKDALERWDPSRFTGHTYPAPADNFDGFRIAAPYVMPHPIVRESNGEDWPP